MTAAAALISAFSLIRQFLNSLMKFMAELNLAEIKQAANKDKIGTKKAEWLDCLVVDLV